MLFLKFQKSLFMASSFAFSNFPMTACFAEWHCWDCSHFRSRGLASGGTSGFRFVVGGDAHAHGECGLLLEDGLLVGDGRQLLQPLFQNHGRHGEFLDLLAEVGRWRARQRVRGCRGCRVVADRVLAGVADISGSGRGRRFIFAAPEQREQVVLCVLDLVT